MSPTTPVTAAGLSIQCEVCHGTGSDPAIPLRHKDGVPAVVGGSQILKAQVCGQCHVTGTTAQENMASTDQTRTYFGNANGYTTDDDLSLYLTARTTVSSEASMIAFVSGVKGAKKPDFLPNGANYSLRHSYYNEWLLNKAANGYGHVTPLNTSAESKAVAGEKCLGCHSGLGFLNRIGATDSTGAKSPDRHAERRDRARQTTGISCQVCHKGHVGYRSTAATTRSARGVRARCTPARRSTARTATTGSSRCSVRRCRRGHRWRHLPAAQPRTSVSGTRSARCSSGGFGGDSGTAGLWGVEPTGPEMGSTTCNDCHMPRTAKEGGALPSNAGDTGEAEATRMSHRFHPVLPGDAERWNLRPNGDSCVAECHRR